jgi:hypothetical protein
MKKKDKSKKKQDMPEFHFKEFTPEEDNLYVEAVSKYREAIEAGKNLRQAYESYSITDKELESFIQADFLKIMIAELHFEQSKSLDEVARTLDVSPDLVRDTHKRMLQEVGVTAANQFGREYGDSISKTND